jgi:hypothetical protein
MNKWIPIQYRDFWDIPRIFLAPFRGMFVLFDCVFDEKTEDYPDKYKVYTIPQFSDEELTGSWDHLSLKAQRFLGEIPVSQVCFDSSKRREIDSRVLEELFAQLPVEKTSAK